MNGPELSALLVDEWDTCTSALPAAGTADHARLIGRVRGRRRRTHAVRASVVTAASGALVVGGLSVANAVSNRGEAVAPAGPNDAHHSASAVNSSTLLVLRVDALPEDPDARLTGDDELPAGLDSVALLHISDGASRVEVVSLYRAVVVDAPACVPTDRIDGTAVPAGLVRLSSQMDAAIEEGTFADGVACAVSTLEAATGIDIDGAVVTDFSGFVDAAEALGGASVCVPEAIESERAKLSLEAGNQRLNGIQLLGLARARSGSGVGGGAEPSRAEREARVLAALAISARDNVNAIGSAGLEQILDHSYVTGAAADPQWVSRVAAALGGLPDDAVVPATVPLVIDDAGTGSWGPGAQSVFADIANDRPVDSAMIATATCAG